MTPAIFPIIAANSACTELLGESPVRFYAFGEAPQGVAKPYAVWQMITSVPANYLDRLPDMDDARVQIDVYGDGQAQSGEAATAIRDALEPYGYMVNSADRGRDSVTRNYGYMLEFEIFTPRTPPSGLQPLTFGRSDITFDRSDITWADTEA